MEVVIFFLVLLVYIGKSDGSDAIDEFSVTAALATVPATRFIITNSV